MSFSKISAELPALTVARRQQLIRRVGERYKRKFCKSVILTSLLFLIYSGDIYGVGPTGTYYLTDVNANLNWRILGGSITAISSPQTETGTFGESAIAVSDGMIRTAGNGQFGVGRRGSSYDLNFAYAGQRLGNPLNNILDGATDGTYNYGVNFDNGQVFRCNLDWSSPTLIFTVTGTTTVGISYDPRNESLWIGNQSKLQNYSLSGSLLSSFSTPSLNFAVAFDYADNTLWSGNGHGTFSQFNPATGSVLQTIAFVNNNKIIGGEFEFRSVPEPSSSILSCFMVIVLAACRMRLKKS